ncbi:MAG: restriction endonuclease subunit S [Burkholderiales bacterium]|nr:restriction endonuclease subunit S [Burkholderiales bacterium]
MSELPDSWVLAPLGSLLSAVTGGGTPSKANAENFRGSIPFMTVKDMHARFIEDTQDHITETALTESASTLVPADTLIVASRMSLGKIARTKVPVAINQDLKALVLHEGINKTYIEYAWRASEARIRAMGTGTTVKGIRLEDIRGLSVPLAPTNEQTRIADQLDTLLTRIKACNDHLDAIPGLLKRFRQAVLDAAMTGSLTETCHQEQQPHDAGAVVAIRLAAEKAPVSRKLQEFILNHPPLPAVDGLPEGWLRTHVGMIGSVSNGSTPSRGKPEYWNGDIPWVSSGEVANAAITGTREAITRAGFDNSSVRLLPAGTVLVAMIGEGKTRGQSALLKIPACINQNVAGVIPVPDLIDPRYLWYWFQRQYEVTRTHGNGSGPKALNCDRIRELEVVLPPLNQQLEIVQRIDSLFGVAAQIENLHRTARSRAKQIAPQVLTIAFRGDLVPQDAKDEPASHLLQRIAAARAELPKTAPSGKKRGRKATEMPAAQPARQTGLPAWMDLPADAWSDHGAVHDEHVVTAMLTAVLKAWGQPMPQQQARLAALLCLQPRLFTAALPAEHAKQWRRLVGQAAEPLPAQVASLQPALNTPWRRALAGMRGRGDLLESGQGTLAAWSLGPEACHVDTSGWPDGRAAFTLAYLQTQGVDVVLPTLSMEAQEFVHARAA